MGSSTPSSQEIVIQKLAELSETQREAVLSFIHTLTEKTSLTPQDAQEVPSASTAQTRQASRQPADEPLTLIVLKRFPQEKQQRLNYLAEKNTEGAITKAEFSELNELVGETQALMLQNTEMLARAIRPDLFDKKGHPIKHLLTQAVRAKASHKETRKESPS